MDTVTPLYGQSLSLLTDLYQLTMAQGYWKAGTGQREAVFHLFFRRAPFRGGYAVACGIDTAAELLSRFAFDESDVGYLATLTGRDGSALFERGFLDDLGRLRLELEVDAVEDGTAVFPQEPLVRVRGPLIQCQLVETSLLNVINFQTLIATKASRICAAARGEPVLEFGLRRAHGIDGGLSASRAAFVGGCAATSNVLAGKLFGIPVRGTHAHSWVMSFDSELESFEAYARAMPNNCVFLVDTYDSLEGVRHAIAVGRWLREEGHELVGVRLDSGDLAKLSIEARRLLDEAGFEQASIVASNDLDEHTIAQLKNEGATIGVWGVGTKLVTAYDEPALGGVYKLSAIRARPGTAEPWLRKLKLSEQIEKGSNPGVLQVRRFTGADGGFLRDMIFDSELGAADDASVVDLVDPARVEPVPAGSAAADLLRPRLRGGRVVAPPRPLVEAQALARAQLAALPEAVRALRQAARYPVGLERRLHELKLGLAREAREAAGRDLDGGRSP
jgi:nicotinate phosphoribosyltransferase